MDIVKENKKNIDNASDDTIMRLWRIAPVKHPWLQGELAEYFKKRVNSISAKQRGVK